jgi:hypothetical protein
VRPAISDESRKWFDAMTEDRLRRTYEAQQRWRAEARQREDKPWYDGLDYLNRQTPPGPALWYSKAEGWVAL